MCDERQKLQQWAARARERRREWDAEWARKTVDEKMACIEVGGWVGGWVGA